MDTGGAQLEELTSGASGRIIPVFRDVRWSVLSSEAVLQVLVFLQSILLWFLILIPLRGGRRSPLAMSASVRDKRSGIRPPAEEEDTRKRRALAEGLEMVWSSEVEKAGRGESSLRWKTFMLLGTSRNKLFCRSWVPSSGEMKALLVIIHGLNEHSGRYAHFAKQLTTCNFGVYAMDWIGHGGSDGLHGYVPSLDTIVEEIEIFLEKIRSENPGLPCFLFGHSTGGAVVLKATLLSQIEMMLEGIILTSPALRVKPAHPIVGVLAPIFSVVLPKYQFKGANKSGIPVSRDPAAMEAKYSDPLVYTGPIRVRTGHEILRISSHLLQNIKSVSIPFLVLHGTADRVTDPLASQDLYNNAASAFKNIKLYEGFLHDLLFEPERYEIGADIIDWMEKRLQHQRIM